MVQAIDKTLGIGLGKPADLRVVVTGTVVDKSGGIRLSTGKTILRSYARGLGYIAPGIIAVGGTGGACIPVAGLLSIFKDHDLTKIFILCQVAAQKTTGAKYKVFWGTSPIVYRLEVRVDLDRLFSLSFEAINHFQVL